MLRLEKLTILDKTNIKVGVRHNSSEHINYPSINLLNASLVSYPIRRPPHVVSTTPVRADTVFSP